MSVDFTGWKSGDRGVIEIEAIFHSVDAGGNIWLIDDSGETRLVGGTLTIKSITRIEPPIKVGDRVRGYVHNGSVIGIYERYAAVAWDDGGKTWPPISSLERIA